MIIFIKYWWFAIIRLCLKRLKFLSDEEALSSHPLLVRAAKFKGKTLVMVHEHDEVVPKQTTDAYIKAFDAEVYVAKGFPHGLSAVSDDKLAVYHQKISDWLKSN